MSDFITTSTCRVGGAAPHPHLFCAPETGRRIVAGFSYLQRIGKGATTSVWFPQELESLPNVEWAAVRQFELLQEAGNLSIDELDVADLKRTYANLMKMRAGGYRVTIITLGNYRARGEADDLKILDQKIQDEIARLIHFLYLDEMSDHANAHNAALIDTGAWSVGEALPHVALTLSARKLYKPEREPLREKTFFKILDLLPRRHILHETAVGLVLPDATKEKNWVYIAKKENQFLSFQQAITNVFEGLDQDRATMTHMRGYGDRLTPAHESWQRQALEQLVA